MMIESIRSFFGQVNQNKLTGLLVPVILGFVTLTASANLSDFKIVTSPSVKTINTASSQVIKPSGCKHAKKTVPVLSGESERWDSKAEVLLR